MHRYLSCCFALMIPCLVISQGRMPEPVPGKAKIINYSDEDGLSSKYGFCMLQDACGYLWFGTHIGLNRYDG